MRWIAVRRMTGPTAQVEQTSAGRLDHLLEQVRSTTGDDMSGSSGREMALARGAICAYGELSACTRNRARSGSGSQGGCWTPVHSWPNCSREVAPRIDGCQRRLAQGLLDLEVGRQDQLVLRGVVDVRRAGRDSCLLGDRQPWTCRGTRRGRPAGSRRAEPPRLDRPRLAAAHSERTASPRRASRRSRARKRPTAPGCACRGRCGEGSGRLTAGPLDANSGPYI